MLDPTSITITRERPDSPVAVALIIKLEAVLDPLYPSTGRHGYSEEKLLAQNVAEMLSGDEIYSNGSPNLPVVGNTSLYIYALTRQPTCDGDTWGCVLLDSPPMAQFVSDGGLGLAAGGQAARVTVH